MTLQWYGYACFKCTSAGSDVTVLIDPFDQTLGLKVPRIAADIVMTSSDRPEHGNADAVRRGDKHDPFFITTAGEYEVKGVFVYGVSVEKKHEGSKKTPYTILFSITMDGVRIGHLGDLNRPLTEAELDRLGPLDVLLLPVGGTSVMDAKCAHEVLDQIEPRIAIPMEYKIPGLKRDLAPVDQFLKEYGIKNPEIVDKFKLQKKDLPVDEINVVIVTLTS